MSATAATSGATTTAPAAKSTGTNDTSAKVLMIQSIAAVLLLQALYKISYEAYDIRLYAIKEFGRVIHEFDPYFNYRATEYLYEHGWYKFRTWFDYLVWYPLGRPVGTTIYPGMQVTAVWIKNHILKDWSINDICVFIPAWFGVTATLAVALLTFACTWNDGTFTSAICDVPGLKQLHQYIIKPLLDFFFGFLYKYTGTTLGLRGAGNDKENNWLTALCCAVGSAAIMSVVPAHLLRSVGGGYDNESIAMTAMVMVFATWTITLRKRTNEYVTALLGVITGLAYFYMVAAWGGYVFVLNLVGVHASALVGIGRYSRQLYIAYTSFFIVGTTCAVFVPVVGWTPLKSLEQMGPLVAFFGFQLIEFCEVLIRKQRATKKKFTMLQAWILRATVFGIVAAVGAVVGYFLMRRGYFGPISSRVRGLFVKHTKTGNPLVDSVAEHQAASPEAYKQYLENAVYLAPFGFAVTVLFYWNDSSSFLIIYSAAAYFFSHKMVRLILLTAPIASVLGGIVIGRIVGWGLSALTELFEVAPKLFASTPSKPTESADSTNGAQKSGTGKKKGTKTSDSSTSSAAHPIIAIVLILARIAAVAYMAKRTKPYAEQFHKTGHGMAQAISHPTIIMKARTQAGQEVLVDDYREAYLWLARNTPEDARIMAWWDYGYQITGIGNRTTLADGNTWNHEHIALLGRILTAPEREAHRIARHLADYVLVWAGGGGDDVAKSPHLRRIANSVYRGLCREPTCRDFGFYNDRTPTESMRASLLFVLHSHGLVEGVYADPNRFREVFSSKYGKVRIFKIQSVAKESKEWVANPANRVCDAPGSWFCPGQYPPALQKILASKKDFQQLEDFNKGAGGDDEYTKQYFENLLGEKKDMDAGQPRKKQTAKPPKKKISDEDIDMINEQWENNEITTAMWGLINNNEYDRLKQILAAQPEMAHIRSEDGRGPMWWAHEKGNEKVVTLLKKLKVSESRTDANGLTPLDISKLSK